ncbi:carbohydrate binding domain-containing protein, partial [Streptococcus pyogenes]|uniref:carbohydrate binding domain-containing protein n=1 Tax=Streptococcus pyogenes TaxID=1314 RepID=UPI003DA0B389
SVGYGVVTVAPGDPLARPGQTATTNVLSVGADVGPGGFGGFGQNLAAAEDWSDFDGLQFWMHGTGSGAVLQSELLDGSRAGSTSADGERFDTTFTDDWTGWRLVQLPFAAYQPATD